MKWLTAPNSDEHVLCDDAGVPSEYRVRRDPVTCVYRAYDGARRVHESLAIYPCQRECEALYALERQVPGQWLPESRERQRKPKRGRYSKRESA